MTMSPGQSIQQILASKPSLTNAVIDGKVTLRRYNSNPPRYELFWPEVGKNIPVSLKDEQVLFSFAQVQKKIFARWKIVIQEMGKEEWHKSIAILNDSAEEIDAPDASSADSFRDLFERWAERFGIGKWSVYDLNYKPLYKDGYFYFKVDAFETHALFITGSRYQYHRQEMDRGRVCEVLKEIGAISTTARFKKKVERVWRIHEDFNKVTEPPEVVLVPDDREEGDAPKGEGREKQVELIPNDEAKDVPEGF